MRFLLAAGAAALAPLVIGPRPAAAHVVEDVVQLGFNGWQAPFGDSGAEEYTDVWAEGTYAYLGTVGSGVAVLDLDTGAFESGVLKNPVLATTYAPAGHADYQDVKIESGVGYFSGGLGTDLVDLSTPTAPSMLARIDATLGGFQAAQNVVVGDGYLYQVSAASPEVRVFDVADPASPSFVRSIDTGDPVGLNDLTLVGDRLYVAGAGAGAYVYDVSSVGAADPALTLSVPTGAATASVWPTADGETLLVTHREPGGELAAWDIESAPSPLDSKSAGDLSLNSFSTAEVVVVGSRAYVAWRQAGIQVMDLDSLETEGLQRAGNWLISGTTDFNGYNGVRSVYPFLGQEQVLISDSKRGLWRFDTTAVPVDMIGDYDADGSVDIFDYLEWRQLYGSAQAAADGNGDGLVNAADYTVWRDSLPEPALAVQTPEPSAVTVMLLAIAGGSFRSRTHLSDRQP